MFHWLRDWWRGYTDADMARVNEWARVGKYPLPARMTSGEHWACIAHWANQP